MKRGCTQCGECLNVCPVYKEFMREEYSPKGKRLLLEALDKNFSTGQEIDPELSWEHIKKLAQLCVGCGRCKQACARKLSTADLISDARANHPHWTQHFWKLWINNMGPLWPSLGRLASLTPTGMAPSSLRPLVQTGKTLAKSKPVAPWAAIRKKESAQIDKSPVILFSGCTANYVRNAWTVKANALLKAWGYDVLEDSNFTCCGGTMHTAGMYDIMKEMQEKNIAHWKKRGKPKIVIFCASCHHGLSDYSNEVLNEDELKEWKASLTPLSTLLVEAEVKNFFEAKPEKYGYHQPCHWEKDHDIVFLKQLLPGLTKGEKSCCGMGGIFQLVNPGLSKQIAQSCDEGFFEGCANILTSCSGCAMQLSASSKSTVNHWLDVISLAD